MRIACFGLSANPPHLGHLIAVRRVLEIKAADEVWLIPCWRHSFRKKLAQSHHRWNMLKLMEGPKISVSDIEFQRKGISYTIDTVRILKKQYPQHQFFWLIGSDIVKDKSYKKWKNWRKLSKLIKFLVARREGYEIEQKKMPPCFIVLPIKIPNISATEIRKRLKRGLPIKGLAAPKIEKYILSNRLYF